MSPGQLDYCDNCGDLHDICMLDAKPTMTRWLKVVRFFCGQMFMLRYAANHGYDFDRLECLACYGKGYVRAERIREN